MMTSYFNLLKYAATGQASPDMTYYDRMRASTLMGGATVQTLTGIPPLSFKADGSPLISWSMKGNGQQTGTPTPDNPVMPEFVGVETENLFGGFDYYGAVPSASTGQNVSFLQGASTDYIAISNPLITLSKNSLYVNARLYIFIYGEDMSYIGYATNTTDTDYVTSENIADYSNAKYCRVRVDSYTAYPEAYMLNLGSTALPYEPFGWAEKITCAGQTIPIYLGEVPTVRRVKKLVLTGTENWNYSTTSQVHWIANVPNDYNNTTYGIITTLCTHYRCIENNTGFTGMINGDLRLYARSTSTGTHELYIKDDAHTSAADFKAFLAAQYAAGTPVTVWYVLATEQTAIVNEPLCKISTYADELSSTDAAVTIPTIKGQNVLTVDTPILPSEMTITFKG